MAWRSKGRSGTTSPRAAWTPMRVGEDPGRDVGEEDGRDDEQHDLDPVEASDEHEGRHRHCCQRHAHVTGDAPDLEAGGDPRHLRRRRAEVCDDQEPGGRSACLDAVAETNDGDQPLPGRDPEPDREVVEQNERGRRDQQRPQKPVAEVGAEDRIGRDPGGIVIGQPGQHARPDDRQQRQQQPALARPETSGARPAALTRRAGGRR